MKLRFFGDSWYWSWFSRKDEPKSNIIKNKLHHHNGFPIIECYLNFLGHTSINHCVPGNDFYNTVNKILNITDFNDIQYNVVFFSSLYRGVDRKLDFDVTNYDNFIKKFNSDLIILLTKLQLWAEKNKQVILLVGGQSTLHKEIFDKVPNKNNLYLLSECITSTLCKLEKPMGIFKRPDDFVFSVDRTWDMDLINHIYTDQGLFSKTVESAKGCFNLPDRHHLNSNGSLYLLDLIFYKIEELEGENNVNKSNNLE